jgi:hypothetical protein
VLQRLDDIPMGILGVRAVGRVTAEDYQSVLEPLVDGARREGRRLRFLYEVGPEFDWFTPGAMWEDAKLGVRALQSFACCAIVSDRTWLRRTTRIAGFFLPCPVEVFPSRDRDKAIAWLGSLPLDVGVVYRLLQDKGVIVVEVTRPLSARDFDALGLAADPWIHAHGALEGVVVHARAFPGWENFASLVRHVQFAGDYLRKIRRVALATDSKLARLTPRVGAHFVPADLKTFGYEELDAAVAWAAGLFAA